MDSCCLLACAGSSSGRLFGDSAVGVCRSPSINKVEGRAAAADKSCAELGSDSLGPEVRSRAQLAGNNTTIVGSSLLLQPYVLMQRRPSYSGAQPRNSALVFLNLVLLCLKGLRHVT